MTRRIERRRGRDEAGMALVLTLSLLALLVLAVYGLSAVVRVHGNVSETAGAQLRARQHALLGLSIALGQLQGRAGEDARVTAMAGVAGAAVGSDRRHWCGVWRSDGAFLEWLVSGAAEQPSPQLNATVASIKLIANGSVGATSADSEHVIAGRIPLQVPETPATPGARATIGAYAYLVLDDGVKVSAFVPPGLEPAGIVTPRVAVVSSNAAQAKLRAALETQATALPRVLLYEQLSLLPSPAAPLTPSVLQDNFHHVTLTATTVADEQLTAGRVNLNTTSAHVWRSVFEAYNAVPGVEPLTADEIVAGASGIANGLAASASGKMAQAPYASVAAFETSALLVANLPPRVGAAEFVAAIGPMLGVRSDTFRIRAYGDVVDPLAPDTVKATANCEAVVQRTTEAAAGGAGRRFRMLFFRWLGPEDV